MEMAGVGFPRWASSPTFTTSRATEGGRTGHDSGAQRRIANIAGQLRTRSSPDVASRIAARSTGEEDVASRIGARSTTASGRRDCWIDTDTSITMGEVDDGYALVQAFNSPELRVRGVSSVFGNESLEITHSDATEVVRRFGPPGMPVHRGASGPDELGTRNSAVDGMAAALKEAPMHIIAVRSFAGRRCPSCRLAPAAVGS